MQKSVLQLKILGLLLWREKLCITGDWCRVRITLFQIHSLWLSFGSRPTWEIIRHLLQPRWCHCRCGPLVRAQTESQARWVKAVSQMPDNHSRSSARDLTTLLRFSKSSWNMRLAFFFCKYLGVAFIQKPSHSNPHNPVLNLKLLGTSALEIRNLHCWWLLSSQNHSIPNPLTLTQPWQQTYMRNH